MGKIDRSIEQNIRSTLKRGKSVLLLGPRQVGKTTLLESLPIHLSISLARPKVRQQYERDIESFSQEIEAIAEQHSDTPLIAVDEVQKVPILMDAIQDLIDRKIAQFILTGSSARKLRTTQPVNWLPGRVIHYRMDPLTIQELPKKAMDIKKLLIFGALPSIVETQGNSHKEQDLDSYVIIYLEEEIRLEALVRNLGTFGKFLQLAAAESGNLINFNRISQDIGVAQTTTASYYQILEDCLIIERIEPFSQQTSTRRRLVKSHKYLFFDLGIRRVAAREGTQLPNVTMGHLFEQFIGLELLRQIRNDPRRIRLNFWRDLEGREVDWILHRGEKIIPIEVKWTERPSLNDARHLKTFLNDYQQEQGYIVCCIARSRKLDEQIMAIPWQDLPNLINSTK